MANFSRHPRRHNEALFLKLSKGILERYKGEAQESNQNIDQSVTLGQEKSYRSVLALYDSEQKSLLPSSTWVIDSEYNLKNMYITVKNLWQANHCTDE